MKVESSFEYLCSTNKERDARKRSIIMLTSLSYECLNLLFYMLFVILPFFLTILGLRFGTGSYALLYLVMNPRVEVYKEKLFENL